MGTVITLQAEQVTVAITGDRPDIGPTYDVLQGWYGVEGAAITMPSRPNAPGGFASGQTYQEPRNISIEGQYFAPSRELALAMRNSLSALYNNGKPITMTVADDLHTTSREVYVSAISFPWTIHREFSYTIDVVAADPRRYAASSDASTPVAREGDGLPTAPIFFPLTFGSRGSDGRVAVTNDGNTETISSFTVSGGSLSGGFVIINVETGQQLRYIGPIAEGTWVTLDGRAQTAFINGLYAAGRYLASTEWWPVPAGATQQIQFVALGTVTGTPHLTIATDPAYY